MIIFAATITGAFAGLLIADREALPMVKEGIVSQFADLRSRFFTTSGNAGPKPEIPEMIPTGLSSITAIYYSSKPDFASVAFDLESADLVRTGILRSPDRIYFDLQDRKWENGTFNRLKTQKAINIAGNLLTGVRISQRKLGATRIVLDLKSSCDCRYQTLPGPPARVTIEIRLSPTGAPAFQQFTSNTATGTSVS